MNIFQRLEEMDVQTMYLLTETADAFFTSLGYATVERCNAPAPVMQTREFDGLCSEEAILMSKVI